MNCDDNCPRVPNGFAQGTCVAGEVRTCSSDDQCDSGAGSDDGVCSDAQEDADGDGIGDACDDDDGDGIINSRDNCRTDQNPDQTDLDGDCTPADDQCGDACDNDLDGDGRLNALDNCPRVPNGAFQGTCMEGTTGPCLSNAACNTAPGAGDGLCSRSQDDRDDDGVGDACDNCGRLDGCGLLANPSQANSDCDRLAVRAGSNCDTCGDACDADRDGDGRPNDDDNCPDHPNGGFQQFLDLDQDGVGSICDFGEREILGGRRPIQLASRRAFPDHWPTAC